ncbi:TIGR04283 family arsenosugar biosynthesis glycosyltransferase [Alkalilimnicola sp. S0819]|uniref:TIGR04283 family arsenosugar biosynthesis glycosyltransferase n=1 Tax=Alkalilimnicola sp. S0819 TaxID=2613922 RepID=UPI0012621DC6|nr:TIGR04283 family arsenosugar biosynthesis glycosyltransferase [Alkalilimnicola sp. S0819]KAB7628381.1 glycosyltransferase [Alkalilimnicola sp. S0819]MPQ15284.1 glycosyltransferase [Alkalilimnicola sp. S0819]
MRISVVIPVLDEAAALPATLAALAPLRAAGHELIVADGGSEDGSRAANEPAVDRWLAAPRGRARQMNAGAAAARGELLWFVHADTRASAAASAQIQALRASPGLWGRFDVRIEGRSPWLPMVGWLMNRRSRLTGIATGDQGIFIGRALFERLGGFPDQPLMEDVALSRRLRAESPPLCLRGPLVTSGRRWDERGALRTIFLMWRLRLAYALGADPALLAKRYR